MRWYTGEGSEADHRASVTMIRKARAAQQWIACGCVSVEGRPPLLSPAYLSEAETYYLRRLTAEGKGRPEHLTECPFYRDQAPPRFREQATGATREVIEPEGFFMAHRLAPEKLAQAPDNDDPDDRARGVAIPRLAKLLWRLMERAEVNLLDALPPDRGHDRTMSGEFYALRRAAATLEVAPGVNLAEHFYTHVDPIDRHEVHARLRKAAKAWPDGFAPQAFALLYAHDISGTRVRLAQGRVLDLKNRIQHIGVHKLEIGGPYLVLVLIGELNPKEGYYPLRGYAQPIHGHSNFMPVQSALERATVDAISRLQYRLRRRMIAVTAKKPVFDVMTRVGLQRPDFVLNLQDFRTGELLELALNVRSYDDDDHAALKARQQRDLAEIGHVVALDRHLLEAGALERAVSMHLGVRL